MEIIRKVFFKPYLPGRGPVFCLQIWDTYRKDGGKNVLGYRLSMGDRKYPSHKREIVFEGEDFCCSPLHCIDSDATVAAIMGFLTLRPGDTDAEYFESYTSEQLEYCSQYAETLDCEVESRFGEKNV